MTSLLQAARAFLPAELGARTTLQTKREEVVALKRPILARGALSVGSNQKKRNIFSIFRVDSLWKKRLIGNNLVCIKVSLFKVSNDVISSARYRARLYLRTEM